MDIISLNEAATANSRIEIINANPDSTSGIITVPKTIASGETVTIPAGRVAVLPNVQVDGVINIEGEVFVPSGATFGDLEDQLSLKAPLVSPAFTDTPTAPTQTAGDNSTRIATTAYVDGKMVLSTAVTASGTAIDFTNIPSWAKRITIMFNGISTNGGSSIQVQLGDSGGIESTGYISGSQAASISTGFVISINPAASYFQIGELTLVKLSGNTWIQKGITLTQDVALQSIAGSKTLSGTLDRIRITTVNGTDTFDSGQINIMYEG